MNPSSIYRVSRQGAEIEIHNFRLKYEILMIKKEEINCVYVIKSAHAVLELRNAIHLSPLSVISHMRRLSARIQHP